MTDDQKEQKMAKSLIALSHTLDLKVVAEGIKDERQAELLKNLFMQLWARLSFWKAYAKGRVFGACKEILKAR